MRICRLLCVIVLSIGALGSGVSASAEPVPDVYSAQEPGLQLVVRTETLEELQARGGKVPSQSQEQVRIVFELAERAEFRGSPRVLRRIGARSYTAVELDRLVRDVQANSGRWHAGSIASGAVAVVSVIGAAACFYTGVGAPLGVWILSGVAVAGGAGSYGSESKSQSNGVLIRTISDDVVRDRDVYIQDETLTHFAESLEKVLSWLE